ncbi:plasma membrane proteolipid 3 [Diutina rugosa]
MYSRTLVGLTLAVFLPPAAVFYHQRSIGSRFWIDIFLCLLAWFPGMLYALYLVLRYQS